MATRRSFRGAVIRLDTVHQMTFMIRFANLGFLQCYVAGGLVFDFWDGIAAPIEEPFNKDKVNECLDCPSIAPSCRRGCSRSC